MSTEWSEVDMIFDGLTIHYVIIIRQIYNAHNVIINSLDARSRYTDFAQTSLRRQKSIYRRHGMLTHAPEVGIPTARCINASRQKPVYRMPES